MMAIAGISALVSIQVSLNVPLELDQVSYVNDDTSERRGVYDIGIDILAANPGDVLTNAHRGSIAVHGLMQLVLCALATTGVEVGTSYIMEIYYHWSPISISIGMTIVFAVICVFVALCSACRIYWGTAIDRRIA